MTPNVGNIDKAVRIVAGVSIIAAGVYFQSFWGALGVIPLTTAFIKWCPLYLPFGINTCEKK